MAYLMLNRLFLFLLALFCVFLSSGAFGSGPRRELVEKSEAKEATKTHPPRKKSLRKSDNVAHLLADRERGGRRLKKIKKNRQKYDHLRKTILSSQTEPHEFNFKVIRSYGDYEEAIKALQQYIFDPKSGSLGHVEKFLRQAFYPKEPLLDYFSGRLAEINRDFESATELYQKSIAGGCSAAKEQLYSLKTNGNFRGRNSIKLETKKDAFEGVQFAQRVYLKEKYHIISHLDFNRGDREVIFKFAEKGGEFALEYLVTLKQVLFATVRPEDIKSDPELGRLFKICETYKDQNYVAARVLFEKRFMRCPEENKRAFLLREARDPSSFFVRKLLPLGCIDYGKRVQRKFEGISEQEDPVFALIYTNLYRDCKTQFNYVFAYLAEEDQRNFLFKLAEAPYAHRDLVYYADFVKFYERLTQVPTKDHEAFITKMAEKNRIARLMHYHQQIKSEGKDFDSKDLWVKACGDGQDEIAQYVIEQHFEYPNFLTREQKNIYHRMKLVCGIWGCSRDFRYYKADPGAIDLLRILMTF